MKLTEKDLPHDTSDDDESEKWIHFDANHVLTIDDILQNRVLNDHVTNFRLRIMQDQFPSLVGLASSSYSHNHFKDGRRNFFRYATVKEITGLL